MDRQDVLGRDGNGQQQADDQKADAVYGGAFFLATDQSHGPVGQGVSEAGFSDGNGEGTERGVGQCHGGTAAEAAIEGFDGGFQGHSCNQATGYGTDDQGNNNVDAAQTQHEHNRDRGNDGIHGKTPGRN